MVGARCAVDFAAATTEVRDHKVHSHSLRGSGKGLCVMALGVAFQTVEQNQQRPIGTCRRRFRIGEPIEVYEIAIRGVPAGAPVLYLCVVLVGPRAAEQRGPDGLRVSAG